MNENELDDLFRHASEKYPLRTQSADWDKVARALDRYENHACHQLKPQHSGQFIYDLNCILDARLRKFDIILILGYTSSSVWGRLLPRSSVIIYNMDGLEWQRSKYSKKTKKFLLYAERLAIQFSDFHISDSPIIQSYYQDKYNLTTEYIAYGATLSCSEKKEILDDFGVIPYNYLMLIARLEPENNIEVILDGFHRSGTDKHFLVVGNINTHFGKYLVKHFGNE
jgi:hypothetical protein